MTTNNLDTEKFHLKLRLDTEKIRLQLQRWQEKLLDMSKANPLLGLNRARAAKLKIIDLDPLTIFTKLVVEEAELRLPLIKKVGAKINNKPDDDLQPALITAFQPETEKEKYRIEEGDIKFEVSAPADLRRKIRRIYDNARTTVEERGVVTLFVALGVIRWTDDVLGESVSPILLIPCELVSKGPRPGKSCFRNCPWTNPTRWRSGRRCKTGLFKPALSAIESIKTVFS